MPNTNRSRGEGPTPIEIGLIAAGIVVAIIAAVQAIGIAMNTPASTVPSVVSQPVDAR